MAGPRGSLLPGYVPHRPAETVLYAIVRDHLEAFLAHARETYDRGLPRDVEQAFRAYLKCGVFAHGFLRLHCDDCGRDLLVAFSCKGRGICPSCGARRMCNTAGHAVDRVLPAVPVRQYVLSLPFELRRAAAFRADVATALGRIFVEAVASEQKRAAGLVQSQPAAMNHIQRFGGALNLNLHFHAVVVDGVFVPDDAWRLRFHETGAPSREALERIVHRVRDRTLRWLRKKGLLEERLSEERSNEAPEARALDACATVALRGGTFARVRHADATQTRDVGGARFEPKRRGPMRRRSMGSMCKPQCASKPMRTNAERGWYVTALGPASRSNGSASFPAAAWRIESSTPGGAAPIG